jgi:radical SAM family uncharacterized protein
MARRAMNPVQPSKELLLSVRKPARYIGNEYNSIKKDWAGTDIRFCLCCPDLYEIGMSNLGIKILYHSLNAREDILCERCFTPWIDMEKAMRDNHIPLYSLESKMPLAEFDILGFSFSYELSYTNMLTMLDLAGIPFNSKDRRHGRYPLVIAGGPCVVNPEPLSDFIDVFAIGDGEESAIEIIDAYKKNKAKNDLMLNEMSRIEGVYIPRLYKGPEKIKKRTTRVLTKEVFPVKPIIPYIQTVHDRISIEIMRGCPNNCHFCQARSIYGPVRMRDRSQVIDLAMDLYKNTGMDELSLLSLSSSSYPGIEKLIVELTALFLPLGVGISLPSLRIEDSTVNLPSLVSVIKKSSLTFAPEAGSDRMLRIINKNIEKERLFSVLREAFTRGWRRVKLYFMIGLPQETDEDIEAIITFAASIAGLRKDVSRQPADIVINVSSFIPKPHTFFEREAMESATELQRKQRILLRISRPHRYLKLKFNDVSASILESVFSRGDRNLASPLIRAWENKARFDAWHETFNFNAWTRAFSDYGIDIQGYLSKKDTQATLPWQHIICG